MHFLVTNGAPGPSFVCWTSSLHCSFLHPVPGSHTASFFGLFRSWSVRPGSFYFLFIPLAPLDAGENLINIKDNYKLKTGCGREGPSCFLLEVVILWGHLPVRWSSIEVVILWGCFFVGFLHKRLSFCGIIFLWGRRPVRLSFWEAIYLWANLPQSLGIRCSHLRVFTQNLPEKKDKKHEKGC